MTDKRVELLGRLLSMERSPSVIRSELGRFPWDSDEELVVLRRKHCIAILNRFLVGTVSAAEVEDWANTVEGRDDIGLEPGNESQLREMIHELANPMLTTPLTVDSATRWVKMSAQLEQEE